MWFFFFFAFRLYLSKLGEINLLLEEHKTISDVTRTCMENRGTVKPGEWKTEGKQIKAEAKQWPDVPAAVLHWRTPGRRGEGWKTPVLLEKGSRDPAVQHATCCAVTQGDRETLQPPAQSFLWQFRDWSGLQVEATLPSQMLAFDAHGGWAAWPFPRDAALAWFPIALQLSLCTVGSLFSEHRPPPPALIHLRNRFKS